MVVHEKNTRLSLLISGPRQPGNNIDVYLEPQIEDLITLWEVGVQVYDAHQQEFFTLRAVLLWTINDFPTYGNLSGCTVKGYYGCPICGEETYSCRLKHGKKNSYTGHRRFLPRNHPYRKQKKAFDGKQEFRSPPQILTGEEILKKKSMEFSILRGKKRLIGVNLKSTIQIVLKRSPYSLILSIGNILMFIIIWM